LRVPTATYCKIEKGDRRAKREQVITIATILNTDKDELLSLWLADQLFEIVKDEKELRGKALEIVKKKID